jgi:TrmH family RNA methyltransferase
MPMPSSPITSRHNPRVKDAAALRNRRQRLQRCETLVYGARESLRVLDCGGKLKLAFVCPELFPHRETHEAAERLAASGVETLNVSPEVFEKLSYGDRHDGVIAVAQTEPRPLAGLIIESKSPLIAVIEGVEKPGNLGALLRTADGAGVDAVIVADPVIDLYNPNAIRASVATVFKPNIAVATTAQTLDWLDEQGIKGFATRPDAALSCWGADFTGPTAIVLGAEANGLSDEWRQPRVTPVALPMLGVGDSLNVAATAAILLYEARRQRA